MNIITTYKENLTQEDREFIVSESVKNLGLSYAHLGRGDSVDCAGLIVKVAKQIGAYNNYEDPDLKEYSMRPDGFTLKQILIKNCKLKTIKELQKGDIILTRFLNNPQHLSIFLGDYYKEQNNNNNYMIHAYSEAGGVKIDRYDEKWIKRTVFVFEYKIILNQEIVEE